MEPKKQTASFTVRAVRNGYIITLNSCTLVAQNPQQAAQIFADAVVNMFKDLAESEKVKIEMEVNGI